MFNQVPSKYTQKIVFFFLVILISVIMLFVIYQKPNARDPDWQIKVNETIEKEFCRTIFEELKAFEETKKRTYRRSIDRQVEVAISKIKAGIGYFPKIITVPSEYPISYQFDNKNTLSCNELTQVWINTIPQK